MFRFETRTAAQSKGTPVMKHPTTQALYAYWHAQCRGRCAPDRHDLDPVEMRGVLPHTFLLEVDGAGGQFPVRVSGTRLDALFCRALKGTSFSDLWAETGGGAMRAILASVLDNVCPAVAALSGAPEGYAPLSFEWLVLPLRHHGRTHARLLCSLVSTLPPAWLGLLPVRGLDVSVWRMVDPRIEMGREQVRTGGRRRNHLVVYEGGCAHPLAAGFDAAKSDVKTFVPGTYDTFLSTRRS